MREGSKHLRTVATLGVAAALTVGGVAVAQGDGHQRGDDQGQGGPPAGKGHPGGPPPGMPGMPLKGLTYAQFHVQKKNGEAGVIRLDQGKITAIDAGSVTLSENDGSTVTVALDEDTEVLAGPGRDDALSAGQRVSVYGPEGEAAETISVAPPKGQVPAVPRGGQLPPPPGDRQGGK